MKYDTESFIKKAEEKHGSKYDYSKSIYTFTTKKVIITCKIHGDFEQNPIIHIKGQGCNKCARESKRFDFDRFVEKANKIHENKYKYIQDTYTLASNKVQIICPKHGIFEKIGYDHFKPEGKGSGCPHCTNEIKNRLNPANFLKEAHKAHGDFYDYSLVSYTIAKSKVKIGCPIHGIFEQSVDRHVKGHGCRKCAYDKQGWRLTEWKKVCGDINPFLYAIYLEYQGKSIIKIGRTVNLIERFTTLKTLLKKEGFIFNSVYYITDTVENIYKKESDLKKELKNFRAFETKQKFVGYTEMFNCESFNYIDMMDFKLWKIIN